MQARPVQRIGFLVSPGFQVLSFATSSAFEYANREMGQPAYDVRLLSETGGPVRTSMGISVAQSRSTTRISTH